jgi:hypothetical protein
VGLLFIKSYFHDQIKKDEMNGHKARIEEMGNEWEIITEKI